MSDNIENLVLAQLKAMREDNAQYRADMVAGLEHVKRSMEIMGRVNERLDAIDRRLSQMSGDVLHLENQNLSRHGEHLHTSRRALVQQEIMARTLERIGAMVAVMMTDDQLLTFERTLLQSSAIEEPEENPLDQFVRAVSEGVRKRRAQQT